MVRVRWQRPNQAEIKAKIQEEGADLRRSVLLPGHFLERPLGLYRARSQSVALGLLSVKPLNQNFPWSVSLV